MFPPTLPIVLLVELLFGLGYNRLVAWGHERGIWHVSFSVVIGVAVTLIVEVVFWWNLPMTGWQGALLTFGCFAASGLPMVAGSQLRTVKESHRRHEWPTAAAHARDDAVMDLELLADQVANKKITDASAVNKMHQIVGTLKSVK
jgi:hypothetical protein